MYRCQGKLPLDTRRIHSVGDWWDVLLKIQPLNRFGDDLRGPLKRKHKLGNLETPFQYIAFKKHLEKPGMVYFTDVEVCLQLALVVP